MLITDLSYIKLLKKVKKYGTEVVGRNGACISHISLPTLSFTQTPLVSVRKTAWKMAIREWEWFLSGQTACPFSLYPWWKDQLSAQGCYWGGYGAQFRHSGHHGTFDQLKELINGLRTHPNSRRLIMTSWNPQDMAEITLLNENPDTPTTCHSTVMQFFVRNGWLSMTSYQRSADMLLGVPHNWIQSWAFLLYLAKHTGLEAKSMSWVFGDAHIYLHPTHQDALSAIIAANSSVTSQVRLIYSAEADINNPVPDFLVQDFELIGDVPGPVTSIKPELIT